MAKAKRNQASLPDGLTMIGETIVVDQDRFEVVLVREETIGEKPYSLLTPTFGNPTRPTRIELRPLPKITYTACWSTT